MESLINQNIVDLTDKENTNLNLNKQHNLFWVYHPFEVEKILDTKMQ